MPRSSNNMNTDQLVQNLIAEASKVAEQEGLIDDALIARTNELVTDAAKEVPETEVGKQVKEAALVALKTPSPYIAFDYNALRDQTSNPALREILKIFGNYPNLVVPMKETEEGKKAVEKDYEACSLEVFKLLNANNVCLGEYKYIFGALKAMINSLEKIADDQIEGHKTYILSQQLGIKNPGDEKDIAERFATYQNLIDLSEKIKKDSNPI